MSNTLRAVAKIARQTLELALLVTAADDEQRKAANSWGEAFKQQNKLGTEDEWDRYYLGVKKRLVG